MGCCASLRAADDSDDARDRDAPQRRRLGRVMPMPSPDDAIPLLGKRTVAVGRSSHSFCPLT